MDNNNTNNTDFIEGDPMPYSHLNTLSQYIRDTYNEIVHVDKLQYDFSLPALQGTNKVIQSRMRLALLGYREEFGDVPGFAQRLRRMCRDHYYNKRALSRRDPTKQDDINRRNRRRNRSLEEDFPTAGMDMLLARKYMSDEESDDEDPTTRPISILRPSYRSDNANRFLERLDDLHFASGRIRRHQSTRMPRSVMLVERAVPEELPRWMKK
ncbi:hypothetical protein INT45_002786 [Circinella minor]|uniref:Uncharacterized protein n=1 Tax=Circinella minor TaxID=1195481 RepID=A0A8H7V8Y7_9FUNG|nr:hypothetical protein INT45_002786 [Circinella minor]